MWVPKTGPFAGHGLARDTSIALDISLLAMPRKEWFNLRSSLSERLACGKGAISDGIHHDVTSVLVWAQGRQINRYFALHSGCAWPNTRARALVSTLPPVSTTPTRLTAQERCSRKTAASPTPAAPSATLWVSEK